MVINENESNNAIRYKLIAQNRHGELIIEIIAQRLLMLKKAREIILDNELLQGFATVDSARIGVIAGMEL